jgi:hypothetical protein
MSDAESPAPHNEPEESSSARKFLIPALVVIVAVIIIGFLASRSGLDKALLKQRVDAFAASLSENARRDGRDVKFTYKDIRITGSFSDRHAELIEPQLSVKPLPIKGKRVKPSDELILRTGSAEIYPKAVNLTVLHIAVPQPIDFFGGEDPSKKLLTVKGSEPFGVTVGEAREDGRLYLEVEHLIPPSIDLTYLREQQAEGKEEQTPSLVPIYETLTITQDAGGFIRSRLSEDGNRLGFADVNLKNIVIAPQDEPGSEIKVAEVTSHWEHTLDKGNKHRMAMNLQLGDITAAPEVLAYAPIRLSAEATYEGGAPNSAEDIAAANNGETAFKLSKFALTTKDANLNATADFVANGRDILPVGMANLSLTNVPFVLAELRKYQLLNEDNEHLVTEVTQLITGTPISELKDANVEINRIRGGSFAIGKTTFEELFAAVLKSSMTKRLGKPEATDKPVSPAAPVDPVETKPSEKIQVEEGARG